MLSVRKSIPWVMIIGLIASISACSKEPGKKSEAKTEDARPVLTDEDQCDEGVVSESCGPVTAGLISGLPGFCKISEYGGKSCVMCAPREIPVLRCADTMSPTFSASENCMFDQHTVECLDPEVDLKILFDLDKKSLKEKYFENLPQVIGGVKFVVGATLKNEEENDRKNLFDILDLIVAHRKSLFWGENVDQITDEVLAVFIAKNPKMSDPEKARVVEHVKKIVELFSSNLDQDIVTTDDFILFLKSSVDLLKVGYEDRITGKINIEKIEQTFKSPKTREMIDELLKGLAGQN